MNLQKLRNCQSIEDLISSFSIKTTPRKFAYVVYKIPDNQKYIEFEIKKANGSLRKIAAPNSTLKYLQKLFADIILNCVLEIQQKDKKFLVTNHGFEKHKSIISNARIHQGKKYLLNLDIKDFFESIHFGRIKGFLSNDQHFLLHNKTAEIIATLATYGERKTLPQGSPLSPILSVLIGSILDANLMKIANKYNLSYTRYADDITFSSNKDFSKFLLRKDQNGNWQLKDKFEKYINKVGFHINKEKTRYTNINNKQIVTGLIVNKFTNTDQRYRKQSRAMVHKLFQTGTFTPDSKNDGRLYNEDYLIGRIYHSISVKYREIVINPNLLTNDINIINKEINKKISNLIRYDKVCAPDYKPNYTANDILNKLTPPFTDGLIESLSKSLVKRNMPIDSDNQIKLLRDVLFFKYFVNINSPVIIPEGHTDSKYLKIAMKMLNINIDLKFYNINPSLDKLGLDGGTAKINSFIQNCYSDNNFVSFNKLEIKSKHPIIFILDYDEGLKSCDEILKYFKDGSNYARIKENIFVILLNKYKILEDKNKKDFNIKDHQVCIENLISHNSQRINVDKDNHDKVSFNNELISKSKFAELVENNTHLFKFLNFSTVFDTIKKIIHEY